MNLIAEQPTISTLWDHSAVLHLLILERSEAEAELNLRELQRAGFHCEGRVIRSRSEFIPQLRHFRYQVVLASHDLDGWSGMEALEMLRQYAREIPFIFVTDPKGEETAVECFRHGATDYVLKEHRDQLPRVLEQAMRGKALQGARTHMIQALHLSEESAHSLFSHNPLPMMLFDVETFEFLDMNHAALNHYGFERAEFLQMRLSDLHPPYEIPRLLAAVHDDSRSVRSPEKWHHSLKCGSLIDVELYFHQMEYAGHHAAMVVAQDFSRHRALEEQLQRLQKFEAIGDLAGGVAHDFNNHIGAILGWTEIGEEQASSSQPQLAKYFRKIHNQCDRVNSLIHQLEALSRHPGLEPRDLDMNRVVQDVLNFPGKIMSKGIEIRTALADQLKLVRADPTQIRQVLVNLCINARDAMPGGGILRIETANMDCSVGDCRKQPGLEIGSYATLSVSDTGIGMDDTVRRRIFEPFFSTKIAGHGTGLGLTTVYGIVNQLGGFIRVESALHRGSSFRIFLPIAPHSDAGPPEGKS